MLLLEFVMCVHAYMYIYICVCVSTRKYAHLCQVGYLTNSLSSLQLNIGRNWEAHETALRLAFRSAG